MRARDTRISDLETEGALYYSDGYRTRRDELSPSGYRVLRAGDINYGRIAVSGLDHVHVSREKQIGLKRAVDGDVVLTTKGTVGRVALVQGLAEQKVVYSPQLCFFRVLDPEVIDPRYLRVALESPELTAQMSSYSGNSDMAPYLNLRDIGALRVPLPDLVDQHAIGEVLGALDDKISANRRVIEAAEALRATLARKTQRHAKKVPLGSLLQLQYGKALPAATRTHGPVAVVGSGGIVDQHDVALLDGPSVIVGRKGTVGATYWIDGPSFPIDTTFWVEPRDGVPLLYLYELLRALPLSLMSRDSAVPGLNRNDAYALEVPLPLSGDLAAFVDVAEPLTGLVKSKKDENTVLASTRDELLPLLMSGKITVRGAEQVVEEVL